MYVQYLQQMCVVDILRSEGLGVNVSLFSGMGGINIADIIPKCLGYHPHMSNIYQCGHRTYTHQPGSNSPSSPYYVDMTEKRCLVDTREYKFFYMSKDSYDPVLLAKLLTMKNLVLMDPIDEEVNEFYKNCVCFLPEEKSVKDAAISLYANMPSKQIKELAEKYYAEWLGCPWTIHPPVCEGRDADTESALEQVPADQYAKYTKALVNTDKNGNSALKLTPSEGIDKLPEIVILTDLTNIPQVLDWHQDLLKRCWYDTNYPLEKITWIVLTSDGQPRDWWNFGLENVSWQTREEYKVSPGPKNTIIWECYTIIWDCGYYYLPHSNYAKVKLLQDSATSGHQATCVGSTAFGAYNILANNGYQMTSARFSPSTMAYYTALPAEFYDKQEEFMAYHVNNCVDFPYIYNCVYITTHEQGEEQTGTGEGSAKHNKNILKVFDSTTRQYFNKLYKTYIKSAPPLFI